MALLRQPLIGITSGLVNNSSEVPVCQLADAYIRAVLRAGGTPLVIPLGLDERRLTALLDVLDGVIFSGGGDIDPQRYNGDPHPEVYGISPERDELEFFLVQRLLEMDKPLLTICRGTQVLNVALGGSLYTHIADQLPGALKHDWFPKFSRDRLSHSVTFVSDSRLNQIYGTDEIQVNSLHHQGISRLGEGLVAAGVAPDGLMEALEVPSASFAVGVQWHPECLTDDEGSQNLFQAFVQACQ
ncbi:MAG: putative glutamine amidotransferase [Chloroflexi bacterium ADurb.Bin120]|jgi:putative glutamine amidotransferase|uniref:Peptidase C26 family protein n=1 Tax=Candidatus Brevifilum fermentans TaxID=1986204 RepID=A0A1Y6K1D5_9CHLR|nr:gamma-glutamyl-gamma-aminobutyrate hydrolase family protein [Brevefilum fermentans]MDI9566572.1 gamma-glutamyl-gamma-aminobutyrate hydrolase family protein [Chloroflexota bacterium]OQB87938.1 MAG: putative glutamine amidotransferase [Chloroflexi bacterium ADurb.Bin120]SMX53376.1 Peptidase C26 family protein [Brevefilum fermentans]HOM67186.1 gamma-glutamyl-gamma-aminobutyrate hydrolase family protein [Brevefilum fermentans]